MLLPVLLACAPDAFEDAAMADRSEFLSAAAAWEIPERTRVRVLGDAALGWGEAALPLTRPGTTAILDSEHLVFDVTDDAVGIVEEVDDYRLLITVDRDDLWPVLAESALTTFHPWAESGAGVRYPAGTRIDDESRLGEHMQVALESSWLFRDIDLERWAEPEDVDVVFRREEDRFQFAYDAVVSGRVALRDAPDGEVFQELHFDYLEQVREEQGEAELARTAVAFASGTQSSALVRLIGTHGDDALVEMSGGEEVRLRGYVPIDALTAVEPGTFSTRLFRCGFGMFLMRDRQPAAPNIPAGTHLYADLDGPPIGLTRQDFEADILDHDYGWALIELETRWGPVEVWADVE